MECIICHGNDIEKKEVKEVIKDVLLKSFNNMFI